MVHIFKPNNFKPDSEFISCFFECDDKILLLKRSEHLPEGGKWEPPSCEIKGDVVSEDIELLIKKKAYELTGIILESNEITYLNTLYLVLKEPEVQYICYTFHTRFLIIPDVSLRPNAHRDYVWIKPSEAVELPLVTDLEKSLRLFYKS